ncbi:putative glucan 1-3-alpha-glucosidase [Nymphaea thermarum]|nr:putative glucan 1-3-alpha-glucosidase [Nymphaea thermarum]
MGKTPSLSPPPSLWLGLGIPLLLCFFALDPSVLVSGWKKEEFRSCNQTPFCKRARSFPTNSSAYRVLGLTLHDGDLTGQLLSGDDSGNSKPLVLRISVYHDGILRLKIDETPSDRRKRFEVPDVLVETLDKEKKLWLQKVDQEGDSSVVFVASGYEAVIRHSPFEVFIRRAGDKERVLSFNSIGLFDFEQLRSEKDEGETWEEHFRSHTDSRPHGPQSISLDVSFHGAKFVYGIPEHATSLALKPTRGPGIESEPYRLFNLDVFEYLHESPFGLYGSIPFMISHGVSRSGNPNSAGFFWLNAAEMQIDVLSSDPADAETVNTHWMSEAGIVDAFFFVGPGPKDVVKQYMATTGTPAMPQLFATAYHQCRWNYRDEEDVAQVDAKFDEFDIPYDVLWLDIEHTQGKKYFTWDKVLFPDPEGMQKKLAAKGRKMVTIVDPHIKRDDSYKIHKEASEKGYYVKDSSGSDFDGWCWPGSSSYLDMLSPEIRDWWAEKFSLSNYRGSTPSLYIWNDMNEPSVFNGPEGELEWMILADYIEASFGESHFKDYDVDLKNLKCKVQFKNINLTVRV